MQTKSERRQVKIRVNDALFRSVEAIARQERRSIPQTARLLIEEGLRQRLGKGALSDEVAAADIAALAAAGGAFDWLGVRDR